MLRKFFFTALLAGTLLPVLVSAQSKGIYTKLYDSPMLYASGAYRVVAAYSALPDLSNIAGISRKVHTNPNSKTLVVECDTLQDQASTLAQLQLTGGVVRAVVDLPMQVEFGNAPSTTSSTTTTTTTTTMVGPYFLHGTDPYYNNATGYYWPLYLEPTIAMQVG